MLDMLKPKPACGGYGSTLPSGQTPGLSRISSTKPCALCHTQDVDPLEAIELELDEDEDAPVYKVGVGLPGFRMGRHAKLLDAE